MLEFISSRNNEKIKFIDKLKKSSHRKKFGIFIIEGFREISRALNSNIISELYFCKELFTDSVKYENFIQNIKNINIKITQVSIDAYKKISIRENGDGLIALGTEKFHTLNEINLLQNSLFLVTENIEKPSNFGAIIRTAESAGVNGIIVLNKSTEIFNPNTIRSSQGAVFLSKIYNATTQEFINFTKGNNIKIFVTTPHAKKIYFEENFCDSTAILVGSESNGVSSLWLNHTNAIKIPQNGNSDSLNVSAATAIVLYECVRQRFKTIN